MMTPKTSKITVLYSRGLLYLLDGFALFIWCYGAWMIIQAANWLGLVLFVALGIGFFRIWLLSTHSISLKGDTIREKRLFSERLMQASEIEKIEINRRLVNAGRGPRNHDFLDIQSNSGEIISIEYFYGQRPDIHDILLGWHRKHK
jgi:hypothetical protein